MPKKPESKTATVNAAVTPTFKKQWVAKASKHKKRPATMAREALEKHITTL